LEKMASPDFGSKLGKRLSREGEGRSSSIPVRSTGSERGVTAADRDDGEKAVKPAFNREQSWREDSKRLMMERLMGPVDEKDGGYSSAAGGT
jgi:hypothetical protein